MVSELSVLKAERIKLEQKVRQDEIEMKRTGDTVNLWKMKAESVGAVEQ
jgi:hypothetical protein